jgi:biopolymer transport protein ExbB
MYRLQPCGIAVAFTAACFLALSMSSTSMAQDFNSFSSSVQNGFETPDRTVATPRVAANSLDDSGSFKVTDEVSTEGTPAAVANNASVPQAVSATRVSDLLKRGGVLMIPIGICSLILLVFVFERFISLRKGRIIPGPFVSRVLEQVRSGELNRESAMTLCERNGSAIANVFKAGFSKWGRPSVEIEQAVLDEGERESNHLRRYLRLINGVATVCPLLGMLGTVLGMIHAFDAIAASAPMQAEPSMTIATGISQALLTTAAGLTVAIPALIAYLFFSGRADRHVMELDSLGMKVVNLVSAEAITLNQKAKTTSRTKRKAA